MSSRPLHPQPNPDTTSSTNSQPQDLTTHSFWSVCAVPLWLWGRSWETVPRADHRTPGDLQAA
eukprot:10374948-Alexandrium_andersonii.AAC.1